VISNAKAFNPPGTIYHTEAERIEAWASDHISKSASCVIEYETEWNIDVDRDEDVNVDADEDAAGGAAAGGPGRTGSVGPDTPARRSPSVLSASVPPINRRGGRNAAAKKEGISETLDSDGHLPGFKDGVGVFPPESDWAEVMLALKLKGTVTSFSSNRALPFHDPNQSRFLQCKRQEISVKEGTSAHGKGRSSVCRGWESRLC
jgi:bromodomain-containing protein 7/9